MRNALFIWLLIVILACGAGASVHFLDGWMRIAVLVVITVVGAITATVADYKLTALYSEDFRNVRILYVATAVIATWPLLACVVSESTYLNAVAVATIPLIGVSIRRALQSKD
jgi:hypothetical protein